MKTILLFLIAGACMARPSVPRHQVRVVSDFVFAGFGDMLGTTFRNEYEYTPNMAG